MLYQQENLKWLRIQKIFKIIIIKLLKTQKILKYINNF